MKNNEKQQYLYDYAKCADVINSCTTSDQLISAGNFIGLFYKKWLGKEGVCERYGSLDSIRLKKLNEIWYSLDSTRFKKLNGISSNSSEGIL